jgi:hypothetical protein
MSLSPHQGRQRVNPLFVGYRLCPPDDSGPSGHWPRPEQLQLPARWSDEPETGKPLARIWCEMIADGLFHAQGGSQSTLCAASLDGRWNMARVSHHRLGSYDTPRSKTLYSFSHGLP